MKKLILSIFALCMGTMSSMAAVITVSNNPNSPGQYTSLQDAIDAANVGDTLLIHASPFNYGGIEIQKRLVLIGEGAIPNQQVLYATVVIQITLFHSPAPSTDNATGTKIYGLSIPAGIILHQQAENSSICVGDVTIERCQTSGISVPHEVYSSTGNTVVRNVISSIGMGKFYSTLISNNIISGVVRMGGDLYGELEGNNIVSNNIIGSLHHLKGDVFNNNIVFNPNHDVIPISSQYFDENIFTNNLFFDDGSTSSIPNPTGSNTFSGNLFQQDPLFVTPIGTEPGTHLSGFDIYSTTYPAEGPYADFHLQASSPGKNYGTDGTDIGIYGGAYPWVDGSDADSRFRYFPMPSQVPYVISMDVLNPTIPQNGTLNINFNARVQD